MLRIKRMDKIITPKIFDLDYKKVSCKSLPSFKIKVLTCLVVYFTTILPDLIG